MKPTMLAIMALLLLVSAPAFAGYYGHNDHGYRQENDDYQARIAYIRARDQRNNDRQRVQEVPQERNLNSWHPHRNQNGVRVQINTPVVTIGFNIR